MDNIEGLFLALEPEIDAKCAELKQKGEERTLTGLFLTVGGVMLIVPALLIFFGFSLFTVFVPILLVGAVLLAMAPILLSKGVEGYESLSWVPGKTEF